MSTQSLINRMKAIEACDEAVEWLERVRPTDMHTAWLAMDAPQWICWVSVRVLGTGAMKAVTQCVRQLSAPNKGVDLLPPPALATLDLALAHAEGKKVSDADEEALLTAAFDAASHGLHVGGPPGSALLAVSYVAHAAQKLVAAKKLKDLDAQNALSKKACAHVDDAMLHLLIAAPDVAEKIPNLVRSLIDEATLSKAWHAIPDKPVATARQ